jgi:isoquinoline 1-oxidoreductase subunit beta
MRPRRDLSTPRAQLELQALAFDAGTASASEAAVTIDRRAFLQQAGVLTLGFCVLGRAMRVRADEASEPGPRLFTPNAFVRIGPDNSVTVIAKYLEMGQGTFTGLATLLAEELDADWSQVRVEGAPADASRYANGDTGMQFTGGSNAMANAYQQMRRAGALARALLVAAAAQLWQVPAGDIQVAGGVVSHPASKRSTKFGALTAAAAALPLPVEVKLKQPSQFKLIGNASLRRKDSHAKTNGSALFTQDLKLPGLLVAVAAHPARFGATLKHVDDTAARAIPGVVAVVPFAGGPGYFGGVAVLAHNTWIAKRARDTLIIEWDETHAMRTDSEQLRSRYRTLAQQPGRIAVEAGDVAFMDTPGLQVLEATYEVPYLAHACMEPMNCLVQLTDSGVSIWNGEQSQTVDQRAIAELLAIKPEQVRITQLYAGGSFGRRASPKSDYLLEAVAIARQAATMGQRAPIKLVWMRADDMRAGYYRPAFLHRIRAALDGAGLLVAWQQRIVGQSILHRTASDRAGQNGIDSSSIEGAAEPYAIPNLRVELTTPDDVGVPVQGWRAVGHTHTAFATECMLDELAIAAGRDPYEFRRDLLAGNPRHLAVLDLVADKAGWRQPLLPGARGERRGRGIAVHASFGSFVAQVAEVSVTADGKLRVERVVCAVDCGIAINPDVVRAQMEGGIGYGLGAVLHGAITLKDGIVEQSDFDDYAPLRMSEMPAIEVHIVPSHEPPSGVGDPGTPPLAPAVVNAVYNAAGVRIRTLPLSERIPTKSVTVQQSDATDDPNH